MYATLDGRCRRAGSVLMLFLITGLGGVCAPMARAANELSQVDLEQLMAITVTGASKYEQRLADVPAAASVITREEIRAFGWRTLDQALASLPGVYMTYDRQYSQLGTRGFGIPGDFNTRVLITLDGLRVNDPIFDGAPSGRDLLLDLDLVDRIEFIPGPGGAVYGQNAMFGVVNIVTRSGAALRGGEVALAAQGRQKLREGRVSWGRSLPGGLDLLLSASSLRARGEDHALDFGAAGAAGVARGLDGERSSQIFARAAQGPWMAEWAWGERRKDDPTGGYFSDPLVAGQFQQDRLSLAQLKYRDRLGQGEWEVSGRVFLGSYRYLSDLRYGSVLRNGSAGDWRGGEWQVVWTGLVGHKLMAGAEVQDNHRVEQSAVDQGGILPSLWISTPQWRTGFHAQDEWSLSPTVKATLGVRTDRQTGTGAQANPRLALIWQPQPQTTWKALYGTAHRAPNAYESRYADGVSLVGNPTLRGERMRTLEGVVDHRLDKDSALRLSVFHWTLQDGVTLGVEAASGLGQYQAGPAMQARGVELSWDKTWSHGARLRGSATWQSVDMAGVSAVVNSPRALGRLSFSAPLPLPDSLMAVEWRVEERRRTHAQAWTGGFGLADLRLSSRAWPQGPEVALQVRNLFDKRYALPAADTNWQDALPQDRRSLRLSLSLAF